MLPRVAIVLSFATTAALGTVASAADYPHPIRVIVSMPAGGGVDTVTRMVTDKMRPALGQPLVVENKAGVSGSLAAETVFKADPDGYTLLASQPAPITTNAVLYKSLNYVPAELVPVAIMSHVPNVVLVRRDFPAKTAQELIAYAKANPGKINYASQGIGTTSHTTAELFQSITGTKLTHVPYKGAAQRPARWQCRPDVKRACHFDRAAQVRARADSRRHREGACAVAAGYSDAGRARGARLHFRHPIVAPLL
jgi:tripartite-type tricarboxylate transporter receptor subunit TctC